jgi:hypothetical protein
MAAPRLLRQRHRATTILISPPSCGARTAETCYKLDDKKGPGGSPGPLFLVAQGSRDFLFK